MKWFLVTMLWISCTGNNELRAEETPPPSAQTQAKKQASGNKKSSQKKKRREKETEGSEAPNRFEADTILKSKYRHNGEQLEVDPD